MLKWLPRVGSTHMNLPEFNSQRADLGTPRGLWRDKHGWYLCVSRLSVAIRSITLKTCHVTSPLKGLADLFPSPRGFAALRTCLTGLWPLGARHEESTVCGRGGERGGERGSPRAGRMRWWARGKESPVGGHVSGRPPLKDAVEEVL